VKGKESAGILRAILVYCYSRQQTALWLVSCERKGKCRDFTCDSNADKISLVYHMDHTKKMKRAKQKKTNKQLSPEMVMKIREIRPKR